MLLSSGFAWRYRSWEVFREQCPGGDPPLQRLILERFDDALDWLEAQGVGCSRARRRSADGRRPVRPAATRRRSRRTSVSERRRMSRRSSRPAASRSSPASTGCCCARILGARATGSISLLSGRTFGWRPRRVLRPRDGRGGCGRGSRLRPPRPALREVRVDHVRRRLPEILRRAELVGDRRRTAQVARWPGGRRGSPSNDPPSRSAFATGQWGDGRGGTWSGRTGRGG